MSTTPEFTRIHRSAISRCNMMPPFEIIGYWFVFLVLSLRSRPIRLIRVGCRKNLFTKIGPELAFMRHYMVVIVECLHQWLHRVYSWLSRTALLHHLVSTTDVFLHTVFWMACSSFLGRPSSVFLSSAHQSLRASCRMILTMSLTVACRA